MPTDKLFNFSWILIIFVRFLHPNIRVPYTIYIPSSTSRTIFILRLSMEGLSYRFQYTLCAFRMSLVVSQPTVRSVSPVITGAHAAHATMRASVDWGDEANACCDLGNFTVVRAQKPDRSFSPLHTYVSRCFSCFVKHLVFLFLTTLQLAIRDDAVAYLWRDTPLIF